MPNLSGGFMLGLVVIAASVESFASPAQPSASASFDVASVKLVGDALQPGQPDLSFVGTSGRPFKIAGNRVTITSTARDLIAAAFGVKDYQLSGVPAWAESTRYLVNARTAGATEPTQDEARRMLQALLVDRFQLTWRRGAKELPVYHLVQAKKSALFKEASPNETFSWNISPGPGGTLRSKATNESIGDFVRLVGISTDRPVIDRTGISGNIDYDILITLSEGRTTPEELNRSIVYAVVDQLGMKLKPAKDRVELVVVDRLTKPLPD